MICTAAPGSIGIFVSKLAKKIIGVELIEEAIADAKKTRHLIIYSTRIFLRVM